MKLIFLFLLFSSSMFAQLPEVIVFDFGGVVAFDVSFAVGSSDKKG